MVARARWSLRPMRPTRTIPDRDALGGRRQSIEAQPGDSLAVAMLRAGLHPTGGGCLCLGGDCPALPDHGRRRRLHAELPGARGGRHGRAPGSSRRTTRRPCCRRGRRAEDRADPRPPRPLRHGGHRPGRLGPPKPPRRPGRRAAKSSPSTPARGSTSPASTRALSSSRSTTPGGCSTFIRSGRSWLPPAPRKSNRSFRQRPSKAS